MWREESRGGDRGAGTVWVLALMGLVWVSAVALVLVGSARVARHRAQSAADLSALAAAVHALAAPEKACGHARRLATANHASLRRCVVRAGVVDVKVAARFVLPGLDGPLEAEAEARAGPR
ncbi:Rv3654c family TadE-like protein [Sphaerisporangium sp. TRM90804]|uniref:Rv3654c family TadE-like protein n=1 Tax=Sphaerisporangium sp. TRM90804 TaxID=3031113 RepID=UPI00244C7E6C|nr:Rv3654c family TadE-like protein [Sphaerisporangium sp. TRM90804]MDH2426731.1 flp pilus-assembly TadE/G-like family protein [Sphaerisporangium sp. TRM90804]